MRRDSSPEIFQAEPKWKISFKVRDVDVTIPRVYIEVAVGPVEPDEGICRARIRRWEFRNWISR